MGYRSNKRITKRDRIIELHRKGIPPEKIASEVGTSIEYVYKENSRYNKKNELVEMHKHESISGTRNELVTSGGGFIEISSTSNSSLAPKPEQGLLDYYDLKPINEDGSREIYERFLENQDAADVISATGFHPDLIQKEYFRYQDIKSRNPFELQDLILSKIRDSGPDLEALVNKAKSRILLTNDELLTLVYYYSNSLVDSAIMRMTSNTQVPVPEGLRRVQCNFCGRPAPGMILDPTSQIGNRFKEVLESFRCTSCLEKIDEEMKRVNSLGR